MIPKRLIKLSGWMASLGSWQSLLFGTNYTVSNNTDNAGTGPVGSFRAAINSVNAGSPGDSIIFNSNYSISLTAGLPVITQSYVTIDGSGGSINGNSLYRGIVLGPSAASATINNLSIISTLAQGGAGASSVIGGGAGGGAGLGGGYFVPPNVQMIVSGGSAFSTKAQGGSGGSTMTGTLATSGGGGGGGGSFSILSPAGGSPAAGVSSGGRGGGDFGGTPGPIAAPGGAGGNSTGNGGGGGGGGYGTATTIGGIGGNASGFIGGGGGGGGNGGGSVNGGTGGAGGYGGGGGGAGSTPSGLVFGGTAGRFGGTGASSTNSSAGSNVGSPGGGGAGIGGLAFVSQGGVLSLDSVNWTTGTALGGPSGVIPISYTGPFAASPGQGYAPGIFLYSGAALYLSNLTAAFPIDADSVISSDSGVLIRNSVTLSSTSTYFGGTTISSGASLTISANDQLGDLSGALTINGGTLVTTASFSSNRSTTITGSSAFSVGSGSTLTMSNVITGTGSLTTNGLGTLSLSNSNNYSGGTIISSGTLTFGSGGSLLSSGSVNVGSSGTFNVSAVGGAQSIGSVLGSGSILLNANLTTNMSTDQTFSGTISQAGQLIKAGTSRLTLSNSSNTYSGGTTLSAGALRITAPVLGSGTVTLSGGTLELSGSFSVSNNIILGSSATVQMINNTDAISLTGNITSTGSTPLTIQSTGGNSAVLTINNSTPSNNSYSTGTLLTSGTLSISAAVLGTSTLTLNGGLLQGSETFTLPNNIATVNGLISVASGKTMTLSGVISSGGSPNSITISGSGTLSISNTSNSYSGGTTISSGTLSINGAVLSTGTVSIGGSSTLQTTSGPFSLTNAVVLSSGSTIDVQGSPITLSGIISGVGGSLNKTGSGTLILSNASNSYSGGTTISAGTVSINGTVLSTGTVSIGASGTLQTTSGPFSLTNAITLASGSTIDVQGSPITLSGIISGVGGSLTKIGSGTLILSNASNSYSGGTTISAGTLSINGTVLSTGTVSIGASGTLQTTSGPFSLTNAVALSSGSTIDIQGSPITLSGLISGVGGSLTKIGSGTLILSNASNSYSGGTTISAGTLSINAAVLSTGTVSIGASGILQTTSGPFSLTNAITLSSGSTMDIQGSPITLSDIISGVGGSLTKIGSGTLILSNAFNSYSGGTTLSVGALRITAAALGFGSVTLNGGTLEVSGSFSISNNMILGSSGTIQMINGSDAVSLTGNITSTGSTPLTIQSTGGNSAVLTIANPTPANNTYSTGTLLTSGTLSISAAVLGSGTLTLNGGLLQGSDTFTLSNNIQTVNGLISAVSGKNMTLSGIISSGGSPNSITISGSGTVSITNTSNSYSGGTTISAGTLNINGTVLSTGTVSIGASGTLQTTSGPFTLANLIALSSGSTVNVTGSAVTFSNVLSGAGGSLTKTGSGTLILTNTSNSYTAGTILSAGSVLITDTTLGSNTVTFNGGSLGVSGSFSLGNSLSLGSSGTIQLTNNTDAVVLTGDIVSTGSSPLTIQSSGGNSAILTIANPTPANNTYSTGTVLTSGTLSISAPVLGSGTLTLNGGLLQGSDTFTLPNNIATVNGLISVVSGKNMTLSGLISSGGNPYSITKSGSGTLTITNTSNSYFGGTIISAGTLSINGATLSTGTINIGAAGTLETTSGPFSLSNSVSLAAGSTIGIQGNPVTISGLMTGVGGTLNKMGPGTLILSNSSNSYTGGTTISAGAILATSAALGTNTVTLNGGTLEVSGSFSMGNNITLQTSGTIGLTNSTDSVTLTGNITSTGLAPLTIQSSGGNTAVLTISNAIPASNTYSTGTILNSGTLSIGASVLGTGAMTLNGGILQGTQNFTLSNDILTVDGFISATSGKNMTLSGLISSGGSPNSITIAGAGTVSIINPANSYGGDTTISSGTLSIPGSTLSTGNISISSSGILQTTSGPFSLANTISLNSGSTIAVTGNPVTLNGVISGLGGSLVKTGSGTLIITNTSNAYTNGTLISAGVISVSANSLSTGDISITSTGSLQTTGPPINISNDLLLGNGASVDVEGGALTLSGQITNLTTAGSLTKQGPGTLILLDNLNDYSGGTIVEDGILSLGDSAIGSGLLTLDDNTTLQATNTFSLTNQINIVGTNTAFDVTAGDTLSLNGFIYGSGGGLTKTSTGTLEINSVTSYSGNTNLSQGSLVLGTSSALPSTSNIILSSGTTLDLGSYIQTVGFISGSGDIISSIGASLTTNSASSSSYTGIMSGAGQLIKAGSGQLTLGNANTFSGGTSIQGGILTFAAGGSLNSLGSVTVTSSGTFAISSIGGSQTIGDLSGSGFVTLNAQLTTGGSDNSTTFSGMISGSSGFTKTGLGTMTLTGANSYTGGTSVLQGALKGNSVSLQGDILNNASLIFNQTTTGTYGNSITGTGDLTVQGSALLNITGSVIQNSCQITGFLAVNTSSFISSTNTVLGTLQGTGTITGNVTVSNGGVLAPGNSIGTLSVIGDVLFQSGSSFEVEISPTSADLLDVSNTCTILNNTTLVVSPEAGTYSPGMNYLIIDTSGGVSGTFTHVTNLSPSIIATPLYDANQVYITLNITPLPDLPVDKQAQIVARCLEAATPSAGSDLSEIISAMRFMSISQLNQTLHEMLPSLFNVLDLTQETTLIEARKTLSREMHLNINKQCGHDQKIHVWGDYFSSRFSQNSSGINNGYHAKAKGAMMGVDVSTTDTTYVGGSCGYAYTPFTWENAQGFGHSTNVFASAYGGGWFSSYFYGQAALMGSFNTNDTERDIVFNTLTDPPFTRTARAKSDGFSVLSHFETGLSYNSFIAIHPFIKLDYLFLVRQAFSEYGADSVDLVVDRHMADMLRAEGGIELSCCLPKKLGFRAKPYLAFGDIYEARFIGKTETASLVGLHCPMQINGLFPEQNLVFLECGLLEQTIHDHLIFSGNYRVEWGKKYDNQTWSVQMRFNF